jgi:hypothetical protein
MRIRIRDPESGIFLTLDPLSEMEKFATLIFIGEVWVQKTSIIG